MTRGLAIVGYGKMGRMIERLAPEYGFEVKAKFSGQDNDGARALTAQSMIGVDVAVEFTRPEVATANLKKLAAVGVASVCGTTGWYAGLQPLAQEIGVNGSALVWGANFSVGLNLFREVVAEAARRFAREESYGAWGWEIHHAAKKDAPSGTLLALADEMKRNGYGREISLSASRAGVVPGTHEIGFDSAEDTITIRHTARSRESSPLNFASPRVAVISSGVCGAEKSRVPLAHRFGRAVAVAGRRFVERSEQWTCIILGFLSVKVTSRRPGFLGSADSARNDGRRMISDGDVLRFEPSRTNSDRWIDRRSRLESPL